MPKIKRERTRYHAKPIDSRGTNHPYTIQENPIKKLTEEVKPENVHIIIVVKDNIKIILSYNCSRLCSFLNI